MTAVRFIAIVPGDLIPQDWMIWVEEEVDVFYREMSKSSDYKNMSVPSLIEL